MSLMRHFALVIHSSLICYNCLNLVGCGHKSIYIIGEILSVLQIEFRIPFLSLI